MSDIIESTYDIIGKLGAGGGGVVYLAEQKRLGKKVVLKADKRSIGTRTELLRREVDILKELNHTYIPHVYDYFIEDDTSYTVMDYVDGESLNKVLEREKKFPQPVVIKWARQLLEALAYLHSPTHGDPPRGYLHSDIKPGNIMLKPSGDICLIDFNISLAIGVESIVGKSPGYSSPEHYGYDFSLGLEGSYDDVTVTEVKVNVGGDSTTVTETGETVTETGVTITESVMKTKSSSLPSSLKRVVVLNASSDIYSVGATLYHLLSGKRPAVDAREVVPLSEKEFSPLLVGIITKAMNPDRTLRYASADEMLEAINGLWKNDPRVKRRKRQTAAAAALLALVYAAGGAAIYTGMHQMERLQAAQVLASDSSKALADGDVKTAIDKALEALPDNPGMFDIPYTPQAQLALTEALGIYDLSDSFKPHYKIDLPATPFRMVKSPDETKLIAGYAYEIAIYDLATGSLIKTLPTLESALCEVEFLNDTTIVYSGKDGLTAYNIESDTVLWQTAPATAIAVSGDKSTVAAIYKTDSEVNFYNAETGELVANRWLNDLHLNIPNSDKYTFIDRDVFEMNEDGTICAVSLTGGCLVVVYPFDPDMDIPIFFESGYTYFDGGFIGNDFAFSASDKNGEEQRILNVLDCDTVEYLVQIDGNESFRVKLFDNELYMAQNNGVFKLDPFTRKQTQTAYVEGKGIRAFDVCSNYAVAATDDSVEVFSGAGKLLQTVSRSSVTDFIVITDEYIAIANRETSAIEVLKLKDYGEKRLIEYDPTIEHSEARLKTDRSSVMLFNNDSFTIVNADGSIKKSVVLRETGNEKMYNRHYRRDESGEYLEVTYYSGEIVNYSADTGEIISQKSIPAPDDNLYEEFETVHYKVAKSVNKLPIVYDKATGNEITELSVSEDSLVYISESGDYIVAHYLSKNRNVYGILMNKAFEPLAYLPNLSDVSGDLLVFDFPSGNIKVSPIYELDELKNRAHNLSE